MRAKSTRVKLTNRFVKSATTDGRKITHERYGLSPLQFVRKRSGKALHDVLRGLGKVIHHPDVLPLALSVCVRKTGSTG